jgi:hypothetical protein
MSIRAIADRSPLWSIDMRPRFLMPLLLMVLVAGAATACEKNNDRIVQEQIRESQNACAEGCDTHIQGCDIKGNINDTGKRYYHIPGTLNYDKIIIVASKGERWFCTETEAAKNGFVRKDN